MSSHRPPPRCALVPCLLAKLKYSHRGWGHTEHGARSRECTRCRAVACFPRNSPRRTLSWSNLLTVMGTPRQTVVDRAAEHPRAIARKRCLCTDPRSLEVHVVLRVLAFPNNVCGAGCLATVPRRAARWLVACLRNRTTHTEHGARSGEVRLVSAPSRMTTDIEMNGTMRAVLQRGQTEDASNAASAKRMRLRKKSNHNQASTIVESMWGRANTCPASLTNEKNSWPMARGPFLMSHGLEPVGHAHRLWPGRVMTMAIGNV